MVVVRRGHVVGEWYKDGDRAAAFNIYSSSKSYMSTAFGLILADFGTAPVKHGVKSPAVKALAAERMRATRKARHTLGKRQKAKIKGSA